MVLTRTALGRLAALATLALGPACLPDPFRGSEVVLELGTANANDLQSRATQHYELFAQINGGLVSLGSFKVTETLEVLDFPSNEKLGVANRPSADGLPQRGFSLVTPANLADADALLLSVEADGETDPTPSDLIVGRCELAPGRRSTLACDFEGEVITLASVPVPLVDSRATVVLGEDEAP